jgi:hypothetical protein
MNTTFDIIDKFVQILNVQSVKSVINGNVCRGNRPLGNTTEDVCIVPLPIGENDPIQQGILNINFHCNDLSDGTPNSDKLNEVAKIIISILEIYQSTTSYLDFAIVWQTTLHDEPGSSFVNIRIRYFIENI